jgi:cytochrome c-type biogenesis protein CcmH/NrfG
MRRTLRILVLSALMLLAAGALLYYRGSQMNLEEQNGDEMLWNNATGDKWLYVGGVMMLIAGALAAAAVRVWQGSRHDRRVHSLIASEDR